jgi:hypothetical protein
MTIKQLGGVFGRNPTFNDVTIEGELTFDGAIDVNSDLTIDGNLFVQNGGMTMTDNLPRLKLIDSDGTNQELYFEESGGIGSMTVRNGSNNGTLRLRANNGSTTTNTLEIDTSGNVKVLAGNLVIGTSGKGIDFSATAGTGTSELLDDYEEGAFSPVVAGTSTAGTYSYSVQVGRYTKIGDCVRIDITLSGITADSAGSGSLKITGLPYSADGTNVGPVWARTLNFDNTAAYLVATTSGTNLFIYEVVDNAAGSNVNVADISSGNTLLAITLTYKV